MNGDRCDEGEKQCSGDERHNFGKGFNRWIGGFRFDVLNNQMFYRSQSLVEAVRQFIFSAEHNFCEGCPFSREQTCWLRFNSAKCFYEQMGQIEKKEERSHDGHDNYRSNNFFICFPRVKNNRFVHYLFNVVGEWWEVI